MLASSGSWPVRSCPASDLHTKTNRGCQSLPVLTCARSAASDVARIPPHISCPQYNGTAISLSSTAYPCYILSVSLVTTPATRVFKHNSADTCHVDLLQQGGTKRDKITGMKEASSELLNWWLDGAGWKRRTCL